jgi:hypothetical protein
MAVQLFVWLTVLAVCSLCSTAQAATIQVNTTQQGLTGQCSLQEAIYASELQSNKTIRSAYPEIFYTTGCTAGSGSDTIVLPPGAVFTFDHPSFEDGHNIFGPTATPVIFSKIIIEGNGATLESVDSFRPNNSRLFAIGTLSDPDFPSGTGSLTLINVHIKGFHKPALERPSWSIQTREMKVARWVEARQSISFCITP